MFLFFFLPTQGPSQRLSQNMSFIQAYKSRRRGLRLGRQEPPPDEEHENQPVVLADKAIQTSSLSRRFQLPFRRNVVRQDDDDDDDDDDAISVPTRPVLRECDEEGTAEVSQSSLTIPEVRKCSLRCATDGDRSSSLPFAPSVTFGVNESINVSCWKARTDLWWSPQELASSRHAQEWELSSHDVARQYLRAYRAAQEQAATTPRCPTTVTALPPSLRRGWERDLAGLEACSAWEQDRRRRGRDIVKAVCALSTSIRDGAQLQAHAARLSAPSRQWAATVGQAQSEATKYSLSVGLLQR